MIIFIMMLSFFLEGIVSNYVPISRNLFIPLFSIISLILIYPFCLNKNSLFLKYSFALGLFYDIVFTNTFILNGIIFLLIGLIIIKINSYFSNNVFNIVFISLIVIFSYRFINYFLLLIFGYLNFDLYIFIKSISSSLILNIEKLHFSNCPSFIRCNWLFFRRYFKRRCYLFKTTWGYFLKYDVYYRSTISLFYYI